MVADEDVVGIDSINRGVFAFLGVILSADNGVDGFDVPVVAAVGGFGEFDVVEIPVADKDVVGIDRSDRGVRAISAWGLNG